MISWPPWAKRVWQVVTDMFGEASHDRVPAMGAALAFYSLFSIGPMFLIIATVVSWMYGGRDMSADLSDTLSRSLGPDGARVIVEMLKASKFGRDNWSAALFGSVAFLISSGAVYRALEDGLNSMHNVRPSSRNVVVFGASRFFRSTFNSVTAGSLFAVVFFLRTLALDTLVPLMQNEATGRPLLRGGLSFISLALLLVLVYRFLPGVRMPWKAVIIGACSAAALVLFGQATLAWYFSQGSARSLVGAAGSIVAIMVWVYYSGQIVLLGAELSKVLGRGKTRRKGGYVTVIKKVEELG
ncbi:YihY/virulence factor BrkB family protein [Kamptonema cortianum]|nr:YihY/virulence factor BrkB family protein [Geitlerinema splendidum]MDK3161201.1 YihY/virulence factor BrkB family protein [Kamptonema cortianum]